MKPKTIKWAAQLHGVREVSLLGTADLTYWRQRLDDERLSPLPKDGRAQMLLISTDARFMGLRFQEISFSILASSREMGAGQQGAYLVQAFNSRRFFAFCERTLFATPYDYGDVRVSTTPPASMQLLMGGELRFFLEMRSGVGGAPTREPAHSGEGGWEGPVFLPVKHRGARQPKLFFVRIQGRTESYPFDLELDWCSIPPNATPAIFESLIASHFTPTEWLIRRDATHAKSKTYDRSDFF